jgi:putative ABC transport system substrate-binding protein
MSLRRREFIAGLGGAQAWPLAARAQQRAMLVVGWLNGRNSETGAHVLPAFRPGLNRQGYGRSSTGGRILKTIDCRLSRPTSSAGR